MNNRDITCVNQDLFSSCSYLKEFSAFVLQDINNINLDKIIRCKLYKVFQRNKEKVEFLLSYYDNDKNKIITFKNNIALNELTTFILSSLKEHTDIFITFSSYKYKYGYLIISSNTK